MPNRSWCLLTIVLLLGKLAASSEAFFMIPQKYHGKWSVPGKTHGTFHVTQDALTAKFRSAELKLKPKSIPNEEEEVFLHDMEIISHPSMLDARSVWKNIKYFYAVRQHGISIRAVSIHHNVMHVEWYINSNYSGNILLTRIYP
jgi:hypothetical protein